MQRTIREIPYHSGDKIEVAIGEWRPDRGRLAGTVVNQLQLRTRRGFFAVDVGALPDLAAAIAEAQREAVAAGLIPGGARAAA